MEKLVIPGSKGFLITPNGDVFDPEGRIRKTYRNGDGYVTVTIKLLNDRWVTFGVHRLVALTFLKDKTDETNEVNHRDCDLENVNVENLEWVTASQNNIHSEIMKDNPSEPTVYSSINGVPVKLFLNAKEASIEYNCSPLDVWDSIKKDISVNGVKFHHRGIKEPLPSNLRHDRTKNLRNKGTEPCKAIKLLDTETGDVTEFKSFLEAGKAFNVGSSHIYQSLVKPGKINLFRKRYLVQYKELDFPNIPSDKLKEAKLRGLRKVIAINLLNKTVSMFESATSFYKYANLSKKTVTTLLRKNRIKNTNNWIFLYYSEENLNVLKGYISNPVEV